MDSNIDYGLVMATFFIIGYFTVEKMGLKKSYGVFFGKFLMSVSFAMALFSTAWILAGVL